jgi:hypothetical protein
VANIAAVSSAGARSADRVIGDDEQFSAIDRPFRAIDRRFDALERKVDRLGSQVSGLR